MLGQGDAGRAGGAVQDERVGRDGAFLLHEFQGEFFEERDLESFGASCHVPCDVKTVVGANRSQAGTESELDIEYIKAVAPEVPLTVVYSNQYSLLDWANEITSNASSPLIHSVSYGNDEAQ